MLENVVWVLVIVGLIAMINYSEKSSKKKALESEKKRTIELFTQWGKSLKDSYEFYEPLLNEYVNSGGLFKYSDEYYRKVFLSYELAKSYYMQELEPLFRNYKCDKSSYSEYEQNIVSYSNFIIIEYCKLIEIGIKIYNEDIKIDESDKDKLDNRVKKLKYVIDEFKELVEPI